MGILLLILAIELVLFTLLLTPVLTTRYLLKRNRPLRALPWAKMTLTTARVMTLWRGVGNLNVAACYIMAGDFHAALPYAEQASAFFEKHPSSLFHTNRAAAQAYLGITLSRSGQMQRAEQLLESVLSLGVQNQNARGITETCAANVYLQRGRLADAAQILERMLAASKLSEDQRIVAESLLAAQRYYSEDFAGGLTLARQAMQRKTSRLQLTTGATITAQICLAELNELREAQALEAGTLSQVADMPDYTQAGALRASANLALKLGNLDRARDQAERAAALDAAPNAQAGAMLVQAEVFALRQNANRALSLTDAILRSEAIEFYKRRARALQDRLSAPQTSTVLGSA